MSGEEATDGTDEIAGSPIEEAVDAVLAARDVDDPEAVRATLEAVAEDGVVTRAAVQDALGHVSKVVATPETRVEIAGNALAEARENASPVDDVDVVAARLESFEARLQADRDRADEHGSSLQRLVGLADDDGSIYEFAVALEQLTEDANAVQMSADELGMELHEFERWVTDADVRYDEFDRDLEALEEAVDGLDAAVEELERDESANDSQADGDRTVGPEPAVVWADASLRHRVMALFVADVRAELEDIRTIDERLDDDADERAEDLASRVDAVDVRLSRTGERLASAARPAYEERFGDRIGAFEATVSAYEPPVDWGEVQAALEDHQRELAESA